MHETNRDQELKQAIADHLATTGPRNWKKLRDQFPQVSAATFWRKVKAVRAHAAGVEPDPPSQIPNHDVGFPDRALQNRHSRSFGFYSYLEQAKRLSPLFADAEELKRQSMDKYGKITNPTMYAKSIAVRKDLLKSEIDMLAEFFDFEKMHEFYGAIMDTLRAESPEVRERVVAALEALDHNWKSNNQ